MNALPRRGLPAAVITGGVLTLGAGFAAASECCPDRPVSPLAESAPAAVPDAVPDAVLGCIDAGSTPGLNELRCGVDDPDAPAPADVTETGESDEPDAPLPRIDELAPLPNVATLPDLPAEPEPLDLSGLEGLLERYGLTPAPAAPAHEPTDSATTDPAATDPAATDPATTDPDDGGLPDLSFMWDEDDKPAGPADVPYRITFISAKETVTPA